MHIRNFSFRYRLRHPRKEVRETARRELVDLYFKVKDFKKVAEAFGITERTVKKWVKLLAVEKKAGFRKEIVRDFSKALRGALRIETKEHFQPAPRPHKPLDVPPIFGPPGEKEITPRRLAFVLHAHLPWVIGYGKWPHGEEWLAEAIVHCYIPILYFIWRLGELNHRKLLTFSITPVLAAQLADSRVKGIVDNYLEARLHAAAKGKKIHPLADWWEEELCSIRDKWSFFDKDLISLISYLARKQVIESSTSVASHLYLPLVHRKETIRWALKGSCKLHRRLFGIEPKGIWLPECAYRPGGKWVHEVTGASEKYRAGVEIFLEKEGLLWTVVDSHLILGGEPLVPYAPDWFLEDKQRHGIEQKMIAEIKKQSWLLARPIFVGNSNVAVFAREPHTARQVWSRFVGYPGNPNYLDFHKRHEVTGLRIWKVTDPEADLGDKLPYWPKDAEKVIEEQADHFIDLVSHLPGCEDGIVTCPFDAELFGHWWYEGPKWLEKVLEKALKGNTVIPTTPLEELSRSEKKLKFKLKEGSWGEGGDHRVWTNPKNRWIWFALKEAEEKTVEFIRSGKLSKKLKGMAFRQLLLASASDWPFLITMNSAAEYATSRVKQHLKNLDDILFNNKIVAEDDFALFPLVRR